MHAQRDNTGRIGPNNNASTVETRRLSWCPRRGVRKRALFRVTVHDAVLQHVRTTRLQQRGGPSEATIDTDPDLEDVPGWIRAELRSDGHALVTGGRS